MCVCNHGESKKNVSLINTFFQIGTVAFNVSMPYCTASNDSLLWAEDTAITILASDIGTILKYRWYCYHNTGLRYRYNTEIKVILLSQYWPQIEVQYWNKDDTAITILASDIGTILKYRWYCYHNTGLRYRYNTEIKVILLSQYWPQI